MTMNRSNKKSLYLNLREQKNAFDAKIISKVNVSLRLTVTDLNIYQFAWNKKKCFMGENFGLKVLTSITVGSERPC